jgi:hypothetical protein
LGPRRDYRAGPRPRWLAIDDLNGDGSPDLVTVDRRTVRVSVLLNKGDGSFRAPRSYRTGDPHTHRPASIAIGDLNGDRKPDVATVGECSFAVSVLDNRGDGSFEENVDYRTSCAASVAIGDLNRDGRNDLATAKNDPDSVSVFINRPVRCTVQPVSWIGLAAAKRATLRANCRVGRIRRAYSRFGKGIVMAQRPRFGAVLRKGGKVNLVVSRGPRR